MRISYNRRTATKVKAGRVQRKNRHIPTGRLGYVLDRESPGRGFRHVLTKRDVQAFIDIVPEWDRFSERLERIVLDSHNDGCEGLCHVSLHGNASTGVHALAHFHARAWPPLRSHSPKASGFQ